MIKKIRSLKNLITLVNRIIAKKRIQQLNNQKKEVFEHFDKNQERLLTLFKAVLKNHTYISNINGNREVADETSTFYMRDAANSTDTYIVLRNSEGIYLEFYIERPKAFLFKEEFDKIVKRKSLHEKIEKKKELGKFLDELIEMENKKILVK